MHALVLGQLARSIGAARAKKAKVDKVMQARPKDPSLRDAMRALEKTERQQTAQFAARLSAVLRVGAHAQLALEDAKPWADEVADQLRHWQAACEGVVQQCGAVVQDALQAGVEKVSEWCVSVAGNFECFGRQSVERAVPAEVNPQDCDETPRQSPAEEAFEKGEAISACANPGNPQERSPPRKRSARPSLRDGKGSESAVSQEEIRRRVLECVRKPSSQKRKRRAGG